MNKKIIALGMAGAMAIAAVFTTAVPVSAKVTTTVQYQNDAHISFFHRIGESDPFHANGGSSTIAIGESRTAIVSGTIVTTTTDTINNETKYIDEDLDVVSTNGVTTIVKHLSLADITATSWASDDTSVATVSNGVVTGVAEGYADITASFTWTDGTGAAHNVDIPAARIYVQKAPVNDYIPDNEDDNYPCEEVDLAVGQTYTIPAPVFRKGTQIDASSLEGDKNSEWGFGEDSKYDDAEEVYTGPRASFNRKTVTLTAKAAGDVGLTIKFKTADGNNYFLNYTFHIKDAVGTVAPDDYGVANYKILNSEEVAYAGMVKVTNKPVIPSTVRINNVVYDVVEIADGAFKGTSIVSVTMPKQTKKIGASAFENCKKLTSLDISETDVEQIGAAAFAGCVKCKELTVNGDKVKTYGAGAFKKFKKKNVINVEASSKKVFKSASKKIKKAGGKKAKIVEQD